MSEGAGHMNHITKWGAKLRGVLEQNTFSCPVAWEFGSVWRTFAKLPSLVSGMGGLDHSGDSEMSFFPFCCLPYRLPGAVLRILLCFFEGDGQTNSVDIQQTRTWEAVVVELGRTNLQEIADTQRPVQEEIYIYIYTHYIYIYSIQVCFSQKEKKSELKMLQYFPSEHTHSSVWCIHMNWL